MIPRLQRFYGGDPERWLEIPSWLFWVYARMEPVLFARESIHRINETSAAYGTMEEQGRREFQRNLMELSRGVKKPEQVAMRPSSPEEMAAIMGQTDTAFKIED